MSIVFSVAIIPTQQRGVNSESLFKLFIPNALQAQHSTAQLIWCTKRVRVGDTYTWVLFMPFTICIQYILLLVIILIYSCKTSRNSVILQRNEIKIKMPDMSCRKSSRTDPLWFIWESESWGDVENVGYCRGPRRRGWCLLISEPGIIDIIWWWEESIFNTNGSGMSIHD